MVQPDSNYFFHHFVWLQLIEVLHKRELRLQKVECGIWCGYFAAFSLKLYNNLFRLQCLFLMIIIRRKSLTLCNRYGSTCVRTCIRFASNWFSKLRCRKLRWIVKLRLQVQSVNRHTHIQIVDAPHFRWFLYFHQHMALRKNSMKLKEVFKLC